MGFALKALGYLKLVPKPVWYALGILAALLMLWHIHSGWERKAYNDAYNAGWAVEHKAHEQTIANYRAAQATAKATNVATVGAVETDTSKITEDKQHDLEAKLADARALAADYARRLRAGETGAAKGDPGQGSLPQASGAPGSPIGAGTVPVMDDSDLQICSVNTVKAKGWQDWYSEVRARYAALTSAQ
jgi:hypothetical protein